VLGPYSKVQDGQARKGSISNAFIALPYLRSAYNELYKHVFGNLEKQWDLAVQRKPREGETAEQVAQAHDEAQMGDGILDIQVEIIDVQEDQEEVPENAAGQQALDPPLVEQHGVQDAEGGLQAQQQAQRANVQPAAVNEPWEFRQNVSLAEVARTMIGALFLPGISSVMGDLLKYSLPTRWVAKPAGNRFGTQHLQATGLLQEKWGRSLVGGCLFVVLKDALLLYCKWKKAQNQGKRKVLDYVKTSRVR